MQFRHFSAHQVLWSFLLSQLVILGEVCICMVQETLHQMQIVSCLVLGCNHHKNLRHSLHSRLADISWEGPQDVTRKRDEFLTWKKKIEKGRGHRRSGNYHVPHMARPQRKCSSVHTGYWEYYFNLTCYP